MSLKLVFEQLVQACNRIETLWARTDHALGKFIDIVMFETRGLDLTGLSSLASQAELIGDERTSGLQELSSFSDLYVKLYDNGTFWVEILNWWDSDINIHDHDFAGVQFQLSGRSLNVQYRFGIEAELDGLLIGRTSIVQAEVWLPGNRSVVEPGRVAPHNVCHLDTPTVSLLIRTYPQTEIGAQLNYFPPSVAGSYGVADARLRKQIKILRILGSRDAKEFQTVFRKTVAALSHLQVLFVLIKMIDILFVTRNSRLLEEVADSRGDVGQLIVEAVSYFRVSQALKVARRQMGSENSAHYCSILSTVFDPKSYRDVMQHLEAGNALPDMLSWMCVRDGDSCVGQHRAIEDALRLFSLDSRATNLVCPTKNETLARDSRTRWSATESPAYDPGGFAPPVV